MKKFFKTVGIVAGANFILFWITYGLLMAARPHPTIWQFFGFAPSPPSSLSFDFLLWAFVVLGAPGSIILDGVSSANLMPLMVLCSILNCVIWGLGLGFPIYAVTKKFRERGSPA
jgi:hypothetical protein